jgi:hypothetical protein
VNLKVEDYYPSGKRFLLRFKEKGGKEKELPEHHKLEELLDQYLKASGLEKETCFGISPSPGRSVSLGKNPDSGTPFLVSQSLRVSTSGFERASEGLQLAVANR